MMKFRFASHKITSKITSYAAIADMRCGSPHFLPLAFVAKRVSLKAEKDA